MNPNSLRLFLQRAVLCLAALLFAAGARAALTLTVVDGDGHPVTDFRWILQEDNSAPGVPNTPTNNTVGIVVHKSDARPIAAGNATNVPAAGWPIKVPNFTFPTLVPDGTTLAVPPLSLADLGVTYGDGHYSDPDLTKRYVIQVMKVGYSMGGQLVAAGQTAVKVVLNHNPLPTSQFSILVFHDHAPINNEPDAEEEGLAGFRINFFDQLGGPFVQDAFGYPIGTTYKTDNTGNYYIDPGTGRYAVDKLGDGYVYTDKDGKALIKNMWNGKFGVQVIPPTGENWNGGHASLRKDGYNWQSSTIEGTPFIDAWAPANSARVFIEGWGAGSYHVFFGFVDPAKLPGVKPPANVTGVTLKGKLRYNHFGRPPHTALMAGGPPVTDGWIGLNQVDATGAAGVGLYVTDCDPEEGTFTVTNCAPGSYELVSWDRPLDSIFNAIPITVPANPPGGVYDVGDVFVGRWFGWLQGSVFYDEGGNGFPQANSEKIPGVPLNIRFRDGTMYQSTQTKSDGNYSFTEVFPFFKWLVAEIDNGRWKSSGMTAVVDDGGEIPADGGWALPSDDVRNPQPQFLVNADGTLSSTPTNNPNTGNNLSRTQKTEKPEEPVLTQALGLYHGQNNRIDWGKKNYGPGESGGISGTVCYNNTRAEANPQYAVQELWDPGVARVQVALYQYETNYAWLAASNMVANSSSTTVYGQPADINLWKIKILRPGATKPRLADVDNYPYGWASGGTRGPEDIDQDDPAHLNNDGHPFNPGDAIQITHTDSWDDDVAAQTDPPHLDAGGWPAGTQQANPPVIGGRTVIGSDNLSTFNQVRPGVFDGAFVINSYHPGGMATNANEVPYLPPGDYVVQAAPPRGYLIQTEESRNIVFGDAYKPGKLDIPPECVGDFHMVPPTLSLFPNLGAPADFANQWRPLADRKLVTVIQSRNAPCNFNLYTEVPKAARVVGLVMNDLSAEFDPKNPGYGEKEGPGWIPISFRDWSGHEVARTYADEFGSYEAMLPSTYNAAVPCPSGYAPTILTVILNDPTMPDPANPNGPRIPDPNFNPGFTTGPVPLEYFPGSVNYADTPLVPIGAFVGSPNANLDIEPPSGTPVIKSVEGTPLQGTNSQYYAGPYVNSVSQTITISSLGQTTVTDPNYTLHGTPSHVLRDFGFGAAVGSVVLAGPPGVTATATAVRSGSGKVSSITVSNPGAGYLVAPAVTISSGGGSGAIAHATISANGQVNAIIVDSGGTGYTSNPTVTVAAPTKTGATANNIVRGVNATAGTVTRGASATAGTVTRTVNATAGTVTRTGGVITAIAVGNSGNGGYSSAPGVTITGGGGSGATAHTTLGANGQVASIVVDTGGTGYTSNPTVTIAANPAAGHILSVSITAGNGGSSYPSAPGVTIIGGGGSGATAHTTLGANGQVASIVVDTQGSGYTSNPTVTIAANPLAGQILSILVNNAGSGYPSAPGVTITGGGGSGATAHTTISGGQVTGIVIDTAGTGYTSTPTVTIAAAPPGIISIAVNNPGAGYLFAPAVIITSGGGSGATAHTTISGGQVTGIVIDTAGTGYTSNPTVAIAGPNVTATAGTVTLTGNTVTSIALNNPGSGYAVAPTVSITGGGGTLATANTTINGNGQVTAIVVDTAGSGYTSNPSVTVAASSSTATATSSRCIGYITSINVVNGGSGYSTAPTVTLSGGGGSGAAATATVSGGQVTAITLAPNDGGCGYSTLPTVTIAPPVTDVPLTVVDWADGTIHATLPTGLGSPFEGRLVVTRGDNLNRTPIGVTLTYDMDSSKVHVVTPLDPNTIAQGTLTTQIQNVVDAANNGDLIIVPATAQPWEEYVIMNKPIRLQGSGYGTIINGTPDPEIRVSAWHDKINLLLGEDPFLANECPGVQVLGQYLQGGVLTDAGFATSPSRIDGFHIKSAIHGGGIQVYNGAANLRISNNRITGNRGAFAGGISLGMQDAAGVTYNNTNVTIEYNQIVKNASGNGAGGIGIFTGATGYKVRNNYIMGNFATSDPGGVISASGFGAGGGGIGHEGLSPGGLIANNVIAFNEVFFGYSAGGGDGAGIYISGETDGTAGLGTTGSGSVTIINNLIQGNLAAAGFGGGIRLNGINGPDVAASNNRNDWYKIRIYNNMIVNNVAGNSGGGISLQDAINVDIVNNTIANNDATATAQASFSNPANRSVSVPQGGGIVSHPNNALSVAPGYSNPGLTNNIIWHNRSFHFDFTVAGLPPTADQLSLEPTFNSRGLLPDVTSPSYTPVFTDLYVVGGGSLNPQNCVLSMAGTPPPLALDYTNTIFTAVIPDEGGNNIAIRFAPIGIFTPSVWGTPGGGTARGDYHITASLGTGTDVTTTLGLKTDIDGQPRVAPVDIGADQYGLVDADSNPLTPPVEPPVVPPSAPTVTVAIVGPTPDATVAPGGAIPPAENPYVAPGAQVTPPPINPVWMTSDPGNVAATFVAADIQSLTSFALRLQGQANPTATLGAQADPVAKFIFNHLGAVATARLAAYTGGADDVLLGLLVSDINVMISSQGSLNNNNTIYNIVTAAGQTGYTPSARTTALYAQLPPVLPAAAHANPLILLNRSVIQDAFTEVRRWYDPQIAYVHLVCGDGFSVMADGTELYNFGFSDQTAVANNPGNDPTLGPDKVFAAALANATISAPTMVVNQDQDFHLDLSNVGFAFRPDLFDPHTVHFHGFPQAAPIFDGMPLASVSVLEGATLPYYYKVQVEGTYFYHCHVEATEHMQQGMIGNLWVEARQSFTGNPVKGNTNVVVPIGKLGGNTDPGAPLGYAYNDGDGSTAFDVEVPIQVTGFDHYFHEQEIAIQPPAFATMFDTYPLLNGRGYPDTVKTANLVNSLGNECQRVSSLITAKAGQKILIRYSNVSETEFDTLTVPNIPMTVVGKDARLLRGPDGKSLYYRTTSVTLGGGETADLILDTTGIAPGTYFLYTARLTQLSNDQEDYGGMMTEIHIN